VKISARKRVFCFLPFGFVILESWPFVAAFSVREFTQTA